MSIGTRLREIRIDHDQTQKQLSELIGCSSKQISRYEADEQEMTVSKLKSFCELYGVSADYILGLNNNLKWPR